MRKNIKIPLMRGHDPEKTTGTVKILYLSDCEVVVSLQYTKATKKRRRK